MFLRIILICLVVSSSVIAKDRTQALEDILTKQDPDKCEKYNHNFWLTVPRYFEQGQMDSVRLLHHFIDSACGEFWASPETVILANIYDNRPLLNSEIEYVETKIISLIETNSAWYYNLLVMERGCRITVNGNAFPNEIGLTSSAQATSRKVEKGTIEYLACLLYQYKYDSLYRAIETPAYIGTPVRMALDSRIEELKRGIDGSFLRYSAGVGAWRPTRRSTAQIIGVHPELVLTVGRAFRGWLLDVDLRFRFLSAKQPYSRKDTFNGTKKTDEFFGGFAGLSIGRRVIKAGSFSTELLVGAGYDGFEPSRKHTEEAESVGSWNVNMGLRQLLYLSHERTSFIALTVRYEAVDYGSTSLVNLSGDAASISLVYGWQFNGNKGNELRRLTGQ